MPVSRGEILDKVTLYAIENKENWDRTVADPKTVIKAQLDLERHGGRKPAGVCARILQRLLALTAAIWHNETSSTTGPARSLLAYDH